MIYVDDDIVGTQVYSRFTENSEGLSRCMAATVTAAHIHDAVLDTNLWTQSISAFSLPLSLDIVMGDVCGGSPSTSMVSSR